MACICISRLGRSDSGPLSVLLPGGPGGNQVLLLQAARGRNREGKGGRKLAICGRPHGGSLLLSPPASPCAPTTPVPRKRSLGLLTISVLWMECPPHSPMLSCQRNKRAQHTKGGHSITRPPNCSHFGHRDPARRLLPVPRTWGGVGWGWGAFAAAAPHCRDPQCDTPSEGRGKGGTSSAPSPPISTSGIMSCGEVRGGARTRTVRPCGWPHFTTSPVLRDSRSTVSRSHRRHPLHNCAMQPPPTLASLNRSSVPYS